MHRLADFACSFSSAPPGHPSRRFCKYCVACQASCACAGFSVETLRFGSKPTSLECMKLPNHTLLPTLAVLLLSLPVTVAADDWMTWGSTYTHDPATGARVDQYALPQQPYGPSRNAIKRSGFRHYRRTLQAGQTADNYHLTEEWGGQVQPYEQWRFPYRPYGVPYNAWGPQAPYGFFNGLNNQFGIPNAFVPGQTLPNNLPGRVNGYPAPVNGFPLQPRYNNQPWFDGTYPDAPPLQPQRSRAYPGRFGRVPNRGNVGQNPAAQNNAQQNNAQQNAMP